MEEERKEERSPVYWDQLRFAAVGFLGVSLMLLGIMKLIELVIAPNPIPPAQTAFISMGDSEGNNPYTEDDYLPETEIAQTFPTYQEDWEFVQTLAEVSDAPFPAMAWQKDNGFIQDFTTNGWFSEEKYLVTIERDETPRYENHTRYVLIHELMHAALSNREDYKAIGDHCWMYHNRFFEKVGQYLNDPLNVQEEKGHYTFECAD